MMNWIRITNTDNIPLREGRSVNVGKESIAIFNLGDRFLAVEDRCPHRGGPLADGIVSGNRVICPLHGQKFCLETGQALKANACGDVETYPVRVENGVILVQLPQRSERAA